ncbi:hypothetical protein HAX54_004052 [Datura stramonium]|uniref:Uncharacterized protein n=1 Tax=Datura stramonium TaxID=4076 RepID=A0ABS8T7G4_DATST|nr:hypothetical protein [Datura stramonium]
MKMTWASSKGDTIVPGEIPGYALQEIMVHAPCTENQVDNLQPFNVSPYKGREVALEERSWRLVLVHNPTRLPLFSESAAVVGRGKLGFMMQLASNYEKHGLLGPQSFQVLLREAEKREFGFSRESSDSLQNLPLSEHLKAIQSASSSNKTQQPPAGDHDDNDNNIIHNVGCCSPDNHQHIMPPQLCTS